MYHECVLFVFWEKLQLDNFVSRLTDLKMKQYFFNFCQIFLRFKTKSSRKDSDSVRWRQMHLSSSGNIAIVGSFLLFQSLLSDYFGKKKFQALPPVLPPVSQKWTTATALIIIFLTTYGAKGRRTRRWKSRLFWLALYCSSMCNLVPLFLKVPDQIDHSSATP